MESPHCKLGPGKCRDCDEADSAIPSISLGAHLPPGWNMDHPWWPSSQMTENLQTSEYDNVLQSVMALSENDRQGLYEYLHKIGHRIFRE